MNIEYEIIDGKIIVKDELNRKTEREITNNIKDILICENDIEKIENLIDKETLILKSSEKKLKQIGPLNLSAGILYLFSSILNFISNNITSGILTLLCSLTWTSHAYFLIFRHEGKSIKISKKKIILLKEQLNEKRKTLEELNNNKENNSLYVPTKVQNISNSDDICMLRKKLFIISDYQSNKRKYIKAFNKGILDKQITLHINENDIEFIKELIKNDLSNENKIIDNNQNNKEKTLKKF